MSSQLNHLLSTDSQSLVMSRLLELTANMSEVLKDFTNIVDNKTNSEFTYLDTNDDHTHISSEIYQNQAQNSMVFTTPPTQLIALFPPQSPQLIYDQQSIILRNRGTPYQLPVAAFQPQTEQHQLIQSPLIPNSFEFTSDYTSHINANDNFFYQTHHHGDLKNDSISSIEDCCFSETEQNSIDSITTSVKSEDNSDTERKLSKPKARRSVAKQNCEICHKVISRDMTRHLRTHNSTSRFKCVFPHVYCRHRSGRFNRPYDFKKHLLNYHFKYDDPNLKKLHNLTDKLKHIGTCSCGLKYQAQDWLDNHILTTDITKLCPYLEDRSGYRKSL